jgi:hypothetical protein
VTLLYAATSGVEVPASLLRRLAEEATSQHDQ